MEQMEKNMIWFCFGQFYNTKEHGDTVFFFKSENGLKYLLSGLKAVDL